MANLRCKARASFICSFFLFFFFKLPMINLSCKAIKSLCFPLDTKPFFTNIRKANLFPNPLKPYAYESV